jgi:hypothetical protein
VYPALHEQELAQLEYECLQYRPSTIAAAAMTIAAKHFGISGMAAWEEASGWSVLSVQVRRLSRLSAVSRVMLGS